MDLKIPSELPSVKPASAQVGDLLAQLRVAGNIEAEVIKLLKDNQLLLNSRLGQILTSNSLNFKPGDRVSLRLDESSGQAVLKASPAEARPIKLDSRQHPQLARALPPDQPVLARVARVVAQRAEIRLAEQPIKLPRNLDLPKNQLLSLQRKNNQGSIEIRPLRDMAVYKAILKQLLPRQAQATVPALIRLLDFARPAAEQPQARPPLSVSGQNRPLPGASGAVAGGNRTAPLTAASTTKTDRADLPTPPRTRAPSPTLQSPDAAVTSPRALEAKVDRPVNTNLRSTPAPTATVTSAKTAPDIPRSEQATIRSSSTPGDAPARPGPATSAAAIAPKPTTGVNPGSGPRPPEYARAAAGNPGQAANSASIVGGSARGQNPPPAGPGQIPLNPALSNPAAPATTYTAPSGLPSLQPLLQLVTTLTAIDAPQIRKWFEFARLVRTPPGQTPAAAGDIFKLLQPLGDRENLVRELMQPQQPVRATDSEPAAQKSGGPEVQLLQARETIRLVEQSLSQNLLQRATLGMQQETQQPVNLSLALPFIDQQQIRPIQIDLQQRKQAQDEADRSWELRLNFELAGLGCIACHLVLEGVAVAASFYAEDENTRTSIESELPQLRQQLLRAGFTPGEFHSFPGPPAPARQAAADRFPDSLIDIEA